MRPGPQIAGSATQHTSRWKWRLLFLILCGLLIVISAGLFFWWQHYQTTPAYTLALLVDAAQRDDAAAFDRVVDMDRVVDNFIPQIVQTTGGFPDGVAATLRTPLQSIAPGVMATVKQTVNAETRKQISEVARPLTTRPFLLMAVAIPFTTDIREKDDRAKATINAGDHQVELLMERQDGGHWRVTSLRDNALAVRIVTNILKDLPARGLDGEMRKQAEEDLRGTIRKLPVFSDK